MQKMTLPLALAIAMIGAGCSNLERSRNLGDPRVSGKTLAQQVCSNCHGVDGNSVSPQFPRLAGQHKEYIVAQLKIFRAKHRSDPPGPEFMWGMARSLTDEQAEGIGEYFSEQESKPNAPVAATRMAAGKKIFDNGLPEQETPPCMACHGPSALGMMSFPRLADQHESYLLRQLEEFQETDYRPGTPMKQITHALTTQQMEDLAGYLQGLNSGVVM